MMTWEEEKIGELESMGCENQDEEDWESYHYIEQTRFESGYYDD